MGKFVYFISIILLSSQCLLNAAPSIKPPPTSSLQLVSDWMTINGIPTHIIQFKSRQSSREVIEFYQDEWASISSEIPDYGVSSALPPWTIISVIRDEHLLTVQVADEGKRGSMGYLSVSRLSDLDKPVELGHRFPKMEGSHVINDIASNDAGSKGRTLIIKNSHSVEANANFYASYYKSRGWKNDANDDVGLAKGKTLRFSKNSNHVTLVIAQQIVAQQAITIITAQNVEEGFL